LGELLVLSQVVLSLQLGFAIIPLIHFTSDKQLMKDFAIKPWVKVLAWISALIIVGLNVKLVYEEIYGWMLSTDNAWWIYVLVLPATFAVACLLLYVLIIPLVKKPKQKLDNLPHGEALEIEEVGTVSYSNIGIPVDFSKNDRNTIRHALIQGGKSATYYLIHIVETAGARYHGNEVMDYETQSDTLNLEKYKLNLMELGYKAEILIGYGSAANAIASLTEKNGLDLLVMGAHGHKGISDWIFGTTLDTVRHKVRIPVLIVR
jgi:manganese transport protein